MGAAVCVVICFQVLGFLILDWLPGEIAVFTLLLFAYCGLVCSGWLCLCVCGLCLVWFWWCCIVDD